MYWNFFYWYDIQFKSCSYPKYNIWKKWRHQDDREFQLHSVAEREFIIKVLASDKFHLRVDASEMEGRENKGKGRNTKWNER
jgi:hypothetical protein